MTVELLSFANVGVRLCGASQAFWKDDADLESPCTPETAQTALFPWEQT